MFEAKMTQDLVEIAAAGGGFTLNAGARMSRDLALIAAAAKRGGATVTFKGLGSRMKNDLIAIASAGSGHVIFSD